MEMEQGDLINLLENLLGPAAAGVAAPHQASAYHDDEAPESYFDADNDQNLSGAPHPSMTGLLSAVMPIGIVIVESSSGTVVRVNKMLLRMLGVKAPVESMQGRPLDAIAPALGAPDLIAALNQVAVTGIVSSAILSDGSVSSTGEQIYRRWTISPLRQGSRSYETLLVTVLDVTEQVVTRRRMEEAVAAAQEQARRLQEHSSFMQERIRQVEGQAAARLQQAINQHEDRVRAAAAQTGQSLDQLRQLEQQLRLTPDQKQALESAVLLANDGARAQLEQSQRELEEARREIERLRRDEGPGARNSGGPSTIAGALAAVVRDLTADPTPAFDRAARTIAEAMGDTCGVFLANEEGWLAPAAFYHPEPQIASQFTSFYTQHPLQPGEGLVGQAVRQGIGVARESVSAAEMTHILPGLVEGAQALGVISAVCAPLRGTLEPFGALLVLSTRRANGGSDRVMDETTLGALNLFAAAIALAAQNARSAKEISASDAQREAVFAGMTDGVAVYDRLGRLRHVNAVAEKLLTPPPGATGAARPMLQGFLDERGSQLSGANLPWMRVLRGEGSQGAVERVIVSWENGAQRPLLLKALPARDASGAISHAVVILHADQSQPASGANDASHGATAQPASGASDARAICERVARAYGSAKKRRIDVRLPQRAVMLAASEADIERAVASLIEAAGVAFPINAPLQMSLVIEPAETATSRPRRYSAGPVPEHGEPGLNRYVATIQLTGAQPGATIPAAAPYLEQTRIRASAFGGTAWVHDDGGRETLFLLRAPLASV
ncbi:MAG TPA: PAS domain-containing protein [Ktedonobacterales bacterium]|jgi:PAS domain-containing protein|nr:PAS domain-containing protein [Ktedonobacterales bacterium]